MLSKTVKLNTGDEIPSLGLGTWKLTGAECVRAVEYALNLGYRHIDTADIYGNHIEVGRGIAKSEVDRKDMFLTSKLWRSDLESGKVSNTVQRFLKELAVDYLDLLLIHWPDRSAPMVKVLEAMEELKEEGVVKNIGVSNFTIHHLQDLLDAGIRPAVNQVEYHPSLNQTNLKEFCGENNIVVTAYSPLAHGKDLDLEVIQELAEKYDKSPAQIILNWLVSKGLVAIPKASDLDHIKDNFEIFDWELEEADIEKIESIEKENRVIAPGFHEFDY